MDLLDGVFVLEVDFDTLNRRLDKEDTPKHGIPIDATAPLAHVVDEILRQAKAIDSNAAAPA